MTGINYTVALRTQSIVLGSRTVIDVRIRSCIEYLLLNDNVTVLGLYFNLC